MSNRLGAFDSDLRQRHAVGKFDEELFRYGRFDKELVEGAIWSVSMVGFNDVDSFGVERITGIVHETALVDGDSFGSETSKVRTLAAGFADADSFGAEVGQVRINETGFPDVDTFGVGRIAGRVAETGLSDADSFGALVGKARILALGFNDLDTFGLGLIRVTIAESGFNDPDAFGTARMAPVLRMAGLADTDTFGALRLLRLVLHGSGFNDADHFGVLISPQHSPRRNSRRRPHLGDIARPRQIRVDGRVQEYFDVLIFDEPADIQDRQGSYYQQESGRIITRQIVIFFDVDSGLQIGDRFVTESGTFLVTNITQKEKQLRVDVERIVSP